MWLVFKVREDVTTVMCCIFFTLASICITTTSWGNYPGADWANKTSRKSSGQHELPQNEEDDNGWSQWRSKWGRW